MRGWWVRRRRRLFLEQPPVARGRPCGRCRSGRHAARRCRRSVAANLVAAANAFPGLDAHPPHRRFAASSSRRRRVAVVAKSLACSRLPSVFRFPPPARRRPDMRPMVHGPLPLSVTAEWVRTPTLRADGPALAMRRCRRRVAVGDAEGARARGGTAHQSAPPPPFPPRPLFPTACLGDCDGRPVLTPSRAPSRPSSNPVVHVLRHPSTVRVCCPRPWPVARGAGARGSRLVVRGSWPVARGPPVVRSSSRPRSHARWPSRRDRGCTALLLPLGLAHDDACEHFPRTGCIVTRRTSNRLPG